MPGISGGPRRKTWAYSRSRSKHTMTTTTTRRLLVDIHTHVYLPRYANLLRARQHVPRILQRTNANGSKEERLVIFENEPISGRPVGPQYWDLNEKLKFMNNHGIDISFIRCVDSCFIEVGIY